MPVILRQEFRLSFSLAALLQMRRTEGDTEAMKTAAHDSQTAPP